MSKVKWDARSDYEFVGNYKVLQQVFQRNQVDKHVEVQKLVRAKYQDNLEFMQWMKRFYELNSTDGEYDAVSRRARGKGAPGASYGGAGSGKAEPAPRRRPAAKKAAPRAAKSKVAREPLSRRTGAQPRADGSLASAKKIEDLTTQVTDLKMSVDGLAKERDFYFGKLRDIEILLQSYDGPDKDMTDQVFKILYATEDDFVVVSGDEGDAGDEPAEPASETA